jgi:HEAT repeat protein
MGDAAKSAVPALRAPLEVPDEAQLSSEEVQVIRNIAYAIGDIGPDARTAVPALKKTHHLRVKYIAEEATAEIEGRPSPTWH